MSKDEIMIDYQTKGELIILNAIKEFPLVDSQSYLVDKSFIDKQINRLSTPKENTHE